MKNLNLTTDPPKPKPEDPMLTINSPHGWLVNIRYDGQIEYGDGYEPDEAARTFWEAMAAHAPDRIGIYGRAPVGVPESVQRDFG